MTCQIYKAKDGWRWRLTAANGRIVADSGEAYTRAYDAEKAFNNILQTMKLEGIAVTREPRRARR